MGIIPLDIDQLITVNGMVIRVSNIIPEIREAFFKCIVCSYVTTVAIEKGYVSEPTLCPSCSTNHCFQLIHNRSHFTDKQIIKLQESPGKTILIEFRVFSFVIFITLVF